MAPSVVNNGSSEEAAKDGVVDSDPEMNGLTLYEKKALIVNRELDSMGMGRYQWMIFFLCGFGYMLDLLWAQAFGLVAAPMQNELGFSDAHYGNIFTSFSAGLTAGAFVFGVLVDIIGRQWAFNLTVLISSAFGLSLGAPSTYAAILVLTAFVGFGVGGNIPIDTTITLEFLPQNRRFLLAMLSVFQPFGVVLCSAIAYGLIPNNSCASGLTACDKVADGQACCTKESNMGWRYLLFTLGGITLFVFFARVALFHFQESPKFLLYRGQDEKAVKVLQYIAHYNGRSCNITLETLKTLETFTFPTDDTGTPVSSASSGGGLMLSEGVDQKTATTRDKLALELQRYKLLFSTYTIARLTLLVWVIYAFDFWGFTIAGSFLPTILSRKNAALGIGIRETYRSYIYIYIFGIPGVMLGVLAYRARQLSMLISSALFGACLFIFTVVHDEASYIGISGLVYFFQSMFNAILYGWTPEAFPAPVRGTACGVASFWGRIFSIVSPLIAARLLSTTTSATSSDRVLYLAGGGVFVATLAIALLPRKMMGSQSY